MISVKRNVLFIDAMAVDEAYRGMDVGHQLFDGIKKIANEKQVDGIVVEAEIMRRVLPLKK